MAVLCYGVLSSYDEYENCEEILSLSRIEISFFVILECVYEILL